MFGVVPDDWAEGQMIFIPKPGKKDYTQPRAYRPITLTPFLFKAMERVNLWEIQRTHLTSKPLHKNQFAFTPGKSCDNALKKCSKK